MKLKGLLFVAIVGALASLAFAAAATLPVEGGVNQAGGDNSLTCQTNHVLVGYTDTFFNGHGYIKTEVKLSSLAAACAGKTIKVTLTKDGNSLGEVVGVVPAGGGTLTLPLPPGILASDVNDVHVAISS